MVTYADGAAIAEAVDTVAGASSIRPSQLSSSCAPFRANHRTAGLWACPVSTTTGLCVRGHVAVGQKRVR
jgi:hypothetical protein